MELWTQETILKGKLHSSIKKQKVNWVILQALTTQQLHMQKG